MVFKEVLPGDGGAIRALSALASGIVKEYYDPLLGPEQNDYMIRMFQSPEAIAEQLNHGYHYHVFHDDTGEPVGFLGAYPREREWYISKFYLKADARGKGYGRKMLDFAVKAAEKAGFDTVALNVNRYNPTVDIYRHFGFTVRHAEKNDIGCGYYMDDYVMEYRIPKGEN